MPRRTKKQKSKKTSVSKRRTKRPKPNKASVTSHELVLNEVDLNENTRRLGARFSGAERKGLSLNVFPTNLPRYGAVSLKKTIPTYIYLGHGHELTHIPDKKVIPECTLSTITDSSLPANLEHLLLLCNLAQTNKDMVTNPVKYYKELYDLYKGEQYNNQFQHKHKLLEGDYHLKEEGDDYQNKICSFILEFNNKKGKNIVSIFRSGLYDIRTPGLQLPTLDGGEIFDKSSIDVDKGVGLTVANIKQLYSGCVYPNIEDILTNVKINFNQRSLPESRIDELNDTHVIPFSVFKYAVHDTVNMDVSQLMERFPGNHYFFICREPTKDKEFKDSYSEILAQRQISKNRAEARLGKPIEAPYHGLTLRGEQHFRRQLQKVFIELYKSDDGRKENKGEPYPNSETGAREEVTKEYSIMLEVLIEYFQELIDLEGNPSPYILKFCNAIINTINENYRIHNHTIAHINKKLLKLMREAQQFENVARLDEELLEMML
jgi:hypothetical protein